MSAYEALVALSMGIGLSAAAGFRIFLPPFLLSLVIKFGNLDLELGGTSFEFFDSEITIFLLGAAVIIETLAYYIPWVDNLLDGVASPAAIIAGTGMTAMLLGEEMSPILQWSLAIIAGGGVSAGIQGATVVTRGTSTVLTGGVGNPIVSTIENIAALLFALFALILPFLAAFGAIIILVITTKKVIDRGISKQNIT
ncbi:MAG: hypothetical protein CND89_00525 [Marine Group II euryarchaeote MED-G38]|nr:hypothetical protein [Euryarchaeota archaeon]OUV25620.1 MAG: hypothetical protein CBC57_04755 [Euryarchaeota archaeon TMED97]PDH23845.1 MAG: hypothetical protein CND89_00525 [Marine Group II euryarchaeote MED-G38]|tara:strand:+ start:7383 stop:7973 length:591 start_codon:yes stop_codon:yes gene_type:complete